MCSTGSAPALSISIRILNTASFAPPCKGPFNVPIADVTAECISESVAAVTRAANVEAFSSWSACKMRAISNALSAVTEGGAPFNIKRKFPACESDRSGSTSGFPLRTRS
jgi:hypothetical protein